MSETNVPPIGKAGMVESLHPAASHELPSFITAPGETDVLMVIMGLVLLFSVLGFGVFFFRLHTLPERMAHKTHKLQFELVAVLGLIALFTHMHIFWVASLLTADHLSRLPVSPVWPGKAVRQGNNPFLRLVRAEVGYHGLSDSHRELDYGDLLQSPVNHERHLVLQNRPDPP